MKTVDAHKLLHKTLFRMLVMNVKGEIRGEMIDEARRVITQTANPEDRQPVPVLLRDVEVMNQ